MGEKLIFQIYEDKKGGKPIKVEGKYLVFEDRTEADNALNDLGIPSACIKVVNG